jgi:hypothetical protein
LGLGWQLEEELVVGLEEELVGEQTLVVVEEDELGVEG